MTRLWRLYFAALAASLAASACFASHGELPAPDAGQAPPDEDVPIGETGQPDVVEFDGIRIATWNVRRFFDRTCDSGKCGPDDFEAQLDDAEFDLRATQIADAILSLGADIVALQEIESQECVDALALKLGDAMPVRILGETGGKGSLDVAIVGRGQHLLTRTHRDTPIPLASGGTTTFARELLEVHLKVDGQRVVVLSAHFKSKNDDDPQRRLAEAAASRAVVEGLAEELPEAVIVLAGDLNDTPGSEPLETLEAGGTLLRAGKDLPPAEAWTCCGGYKNWLDHVLISTEAAGTYSVGTATVHRTDEYGFEGSDHAALSVGVTLE